MNVFTVVIAGVALEIHSPLTMAEMGLTARLGPFLTPTAAPVIRTTVQWREGNPGALPHGELLFDPGEIWRLYRDAAGDGLCARVCYPGQDPTDGGAGLLIDRHWRNITLTEKRAGGAWQSLLAYGVGELIFRTRILYASGLVLHASGLDDHGRAVVFAGQSGAGKSTQLGWWLDEPGVVAMNDDRIGIRVGEEGVVAYGTPWGGTSNIARNHAAPLAAVVLLEQAPENAIVPLSPATATQMLLPRMYLPFWDEELLQRATAGLAALVARVPVFLLRARREPGVVALVRSVL